MQPLGGVLGLDTELVGEHLCRNSRRGETDHRPGSVLFLPGGPEACHRGGLAGAGRTDEHVKDTAGGGDLLDGEGLVDAQSVVASGQVRRGDVRDCRRAHPNSSVLSPGFEEAIFGLEEDLGGVDEVVPRLKARGPVRADVTLRGVVHRRRSEHDRSGDGEVGDVLGDGHAVIGRGEADPVQQPVSLGQKVLATVGGMVLGHGRDHRLSGIVEDRLGRSSARSSGRSLRPARLETQASCSSSGT